MAKAKRMARGLGLALGLLLGSTVTAAMPPPAPAPGVGTPVQAGAPVDVALVLAVDISLSMDRGEQLLQRQGYVEALVHPDVLGAIRRGFVQRIAVAYVEWGSTTDVHLVLPWTLIEDRASAEAVAARLADRPIHRSRSTAISAAIDFSVALFDRLEAEALRRVIDVSGDGPNNEGRPVLDARAAALAAGIVINGLPIMVREMGFSPWSIPHLDAYYAECVIGGPASFVLPVRDTADLGEAIRRKLVLEIAGQAPAAIPAAMPHAAADAAVDCEIGEKLRRQMWGN